MDEPILSIKNLKMKKIVLIISVLIAFSLSSCGHKSSDTSTKSSPESNTAPPSTATVTYECPMKCLPADDKAGKCAKCGMDKKEVKH